MEDEIKNQEEVPPSVKDYLENGPFKVIDTPGQEEVVLIRTFGDEKYAFSLPSPRSILQQSHAAENEAEKTQH